MEAAIPGIEIVVPALPPVAGAAIRALSLGGVEITSEIMANLRVGCP